MTSSADKFDRPMLISIFSLELNEKPLDISDSWNVESPKSNIIESGVRYCIHRFSGVFGYNGPSHLNINNSIMNALNSKQLKLINNNNIKRNYIYVKDVAKIIYKTAIEEIKGIHIVAGKEIKTFKEMIIDITSTLNPTLLPEITRGVNSSINQIYKHSKDLPEPSNFIDCLNDIKIDFLKKWR